MIDKIKFKIGKKKAMLEYICEHLKREYYFSVIEDLFLYCFNLATDIRIGTAYSIKYLYQKKMYIKSFSL